MDSLMLDNLDEAILDEGRLVSFKWITSSFNIPLNSAKQILYQYMKHIGSTRPEVKLNATYLVSGMICDVDGNDTHQICVVNEDELKKLQSHIKNLYSIHVYSLQKSLVRDNNVITSPLISDQNKGNLSSQNMITLGSLQIKESCPKAEILTPKLSPSKNKNGDQKGLDTARKNTKQSGIGALFANQEKKNGRLQPKKEPISNKPKKSGGLDSFLVKGVKQVKSEDAPHQEKNTSPKEKSKEVKEELMELSDNENPLPKSVRTYSKNAATNKRKKQSQSSQSKRRRIMTVESSESEASEEEEEPIEESPMPPTPQKKILASDSDEIGETPPEVQKGKRRVKKLVSKMYEDEKGYLVTKKEYEIVSEESDGEEPIPPKKTTPVKQVSPQKSKLKSTKKQASIMNFFKKK